MGFPCRFRREFTHRSTESRDRGSNSPQWVHFLAASVDVPTPCPTPRVSPLFSRGGSSPARPILWPFVARAFDFPIANAWFRFVAVGCLCCNWPQHVPRAVKHFLSQICWPPRPFSLGRVTRTAGSRTPVRVVSAHAGLIERRNDHSRHRVCVPVRTYS